jgi:predicted PurR-regulated permease PerM
MVQFAMKPQKVEISYKTIIFTALLVIGLYLTWLLRGLILILFICLLLTEALNPTITKLEKLKIPRTLGILLVYLIIIAVISFSVASVVPIFVAQTSGLIKTLPGTLANIRIFGASAIDLSSQFKIIESLPSEIAQTALSLFSNLAIGLLTLIITFFLLHERNRVNIYSQKVFSAGGQVKVTKIINLLEHRLGKWFNSFLLLMLIIGLLSYLAYVIIGLNYAVPLAIIAGLSEIIPIIGATVAIALAGLVGLTISPLTALITVLVCILIHSVINNILTPKIMKETIGLNPLVSILVMTIGAELAGATGAILAIPIFLTIQIIFEVLLEKK